jgi:NitT/TauT family transport system ATP-binding protein
MDAVTSSLPSPLALEPTHRQQEPAVRERFRRLYERPVRLRVERLGKRFETDAGEVAALSDVSFQVHRRELMCVIGPSGCGKSTLGRIVAGLEEPSEGALLLDGEPIVGPCRDRGMVFQGYTLFPWRTVIENVAFGLEMAGKGRTEAEQEASAWVQLVGLAKFAEAYPHQLSGGMKQRVAIARALANKPQILVMDEPFGALDAQTRAQMQSYLLQIWKEVDVTILFVTHDLDETVYLADRVLVMGAHPGRVLEIVENPVPRPRDPSQLESAPFVAMRRHLARLIHGDGPPVAEPLPRMRMTQVGDDVE